VGRVQEILSPYKPKSPSRPPEDLSLQCVTPLPIIAATNILCVQLNLSGIEISPVLDVQGGHSGEDLHAPRSIPADDECIPNMCLSAAVDVVARLVENKRNIEALFRDIGVYHNNMALAARFDVEVFASSGTLSVRGIRNFVQFRISDGRTLCIIVAFIEANVDDLGSPEMSVDWYMNDRFVSITLIVPSPGSDLICDSERFNSLLGLSVLYSFDWRRNGNHIAVTMPCSSESIPSRNLHPAYVFRQ
jgi:hypothetical protein